MSLPRLSLLHSSLLKSALLSEPSFQRASSQTSIACRVRERIRTPQRRFQSTNFERYGPAKDLLPPPQKPDSKPLNTREDGDSQQQPRASDEGNVAKKDAGSEPERLDTTKASKEEAEITKSDAGEAHPPEKVEGPQLEAPDHPLEKVLQMPAPTSADKAKPPHLETPPYVHHFDTYTLVKDLGKGGFTQDQSITVMKAVRSLLAANLELAREGLVSKSDVENVCSSVHSGSKWWSLNVTDTMLRRNRISSAQHAPSSVLKSKIRARLQQIKCEASAHIFNMRLRF